MAKESFVGEPITLPDRIQYEQDLCISLIHRQRAYRDTRKGIVDELIWRHLTRVDVPKGYKVAVYLPTMLGPEDPIAAVLVKVPGVSWEESQWEWCWEQPWAKPLKSLQSALSYLHVTELSHTYVLVPGGAYEREHRLSAKAFKL